MAVGPAVGRCARRVVGLFLQPVHQARETVVDQRKVDAFLAVEINVRRPFTGLRGGGDVAEPDLVKGGAANTLAAVDAIGSRFFSSGRGSADADPPASRILGTAT